MGELGRQMGRVNRGEGCMIPESRAPRSLFFFSPCSVLWIRLHYLDILFLGWLHRYRRTQFIYMYT